MADARHAATQGAAKPHRVGLSPRGEQARDKLKRALIRVLDRTPSQRVRIVDVTAEAGVATGLFYHYFQDLRSLVTEALDDFLAELEATSRIEAGIAKGDWYHRILAHYRVMVRCYSQSPGLMRCITDASNEYPQLRELWLRSYHRQLDILAGLLPRIFPGSGLQEIEAKLIVEALGGIGQTILHERYIERRRDLASLTDDALAEWLAAIFYRGLFANNPPAQALRHAGTINRLQRVDTSVYAAAAG